MIDPETWDEPANPTLAGLRVALVSPGAFAFGGSEEAMAAALAGLRGAGALVRLFGSTDGGGAEVRALALSESLRPFDRAGASAVAAFADELASWADVVDFQRLAPLELVRALRGRVPCVLTVHTVEHTCPAGSRFLRRSGSTCTQAPGLGCIAHDRREQCLCFADGRPFSWRDSLHALAQMRRHRALAQSLDLAIYNSEATRRCFERFVGRPRAAVIHPPLIAPAAAARREASRLVFVGRIESFKGVHDLPEILAALPGATLEVVGDGSALPELRARFAAKNLQARVELRGWASRAEVSAALARASCALAPSYGFEAWGMVGPEAIAQGCPVVAYDSGGMAEWCQPPYGTLVPMGDVAAMAGAARATLERMAGGLDTSSWHAAAERRFGPARWLGEYAAALAPLAAKKAAP